MTGKRSFWHSSAECKSSGPSDPCPFKASCPDGDFETFALQRSNISDSTSATINIHGANNVYIHFTQRKPERR